jgi:hypothetical protein
MIYGIVGHPFRRLGSGKTTILTWLALSYRLNIGMKIYTNYHLYNVPYTLLQNPKEIADLEHAFIGIDDLYRAFGGRQKSVERFTKIISGESSKAENVIAYSSSALINYVPRLLRDHTDYYIRPLFDAKSGVMYLECFNTAGVPEQVVPPYLPPISTAALFEYFNTKEKVKVWTDF